MIVILRRAIIMIGLLCVGALSAQAQEWNTDRPGNDFQNFDLRAPDYNLCRQACEGNASCRAWTYVNPGVQGPQARCYLKAPAPAPVANNCCVSGQKAADTSDREDICRDYAVRAVQQNDENMRLRCNFTGPAWQSNRNGHFDWCMTASRADREREDRNRAQKLNECRTNGGGGGGGGGGGREDECRDYAEEAIAQARENTDLGCGFSGARWSARYAEHFNWCLSATRDQVRAERTARARDLRSCRGGSDGGGDRSEACRDYAEEAVAQIAESRRRSCRFSGPRWEGGYNVHYSWCMSARPAQRDAEKQARTQDLRRCRSGDSEGDRAQACEDYAQTSIAQIREARRLGCGFSGSRWQPSTAAHYSWCMTARRAERDAELRARETALDRCRADVGQGGDDDDQGCVDYANRAVRQAQRNRALRCGFEGQRWEPSFDAHYSWCQSAPPRARQREDAKRQSLVDICAAKPDRAQDCRRYSNLAIEQQRVNLAQGCGFSGPRWHTNYEDHFVWCMQTSSAGRLAETAARVGALLACTR